MSRSQFLVQSRAWQEDEGLWDRTDRPGFLPFVPLRLFDDRAAAEAFRDDIVRRLRLTINPFDLGLHTSELTSMRERAFCDCLWGLEVVPPVPSKMSGSHSSDETDWRAWWAETVPVLTLEQIAGVWALFDRLRLVEVVELPLDR